MTSNSLTGGLFYYSLNKDLVLKTLGNAPRNNSTAQANNTDPKGGK